MPFSVFFLTAFFRTLPTAVAEAALIDGCSHTGVFFRVMLHMAHLGIVSVALFNVLGFWNQYLLPLVLNQGDKSTAARAARRVRGPTATESRRARWSGRG